MIIGQATPDNEYLHHISLLPSLYTLFNFLKLNKEKLSSTMQNILTTLTSWTFFNWSSWLTKAIAASLSNLWPPFLKVLLIIFNGWKCIFLLSTDIAKSWDASEGSMWSCDSGSEQWNHLVKLWHSDASPGAGQKLQLLAIFLLMQKYSIIQLVKSIDSFSIFHHFFSF